MSIQAAKLTVDVESNALKVSGEVKQLGQDVNKAGQEGSGGIKGLEDRFNSFKGSVLPAAAIVTGFAVTAKKAFDLGAEGASIKRLEDASTSLARTMGSNMEEIVASVRKASMNSVSDLEIMRATTRAMMLGLGSDAEKMGQLMEVAAFRGRAMGLSTTQAFNDIVTGVGRMSPMILDNLGIVLDAEKTYSDYAAALGKTSNELTSAEKRQALLNRVIQEGQSQIEAAGGIAADAATPFEELSANIENAANAFKEWASVPASNVATAINVIAFGNQKIADAYKEHAKEVTATSRTYEEYSAEMLRSMEASGQFDKFLIEVAMGLRGDADMAAAAREQLGLYTEAQWNGIQAANEWGDGQREAMRAAEGSAPVIREVGQAFWDTNAAAKQSADSAHAMGQSLLDLVGAQNQLASAQEGLAASTANFKQGVGGDMGRMLEQAGVKGEQFRSALAAIDEKQGTNLLGARNLQEEQKRLIDQYARDGDLKKFREGLDYINDGYAPLNESVEKSTELVDKLVGLVKEFEGVHWATFRVRDETGMGGGGGGGGGGGIPGGRCFVHQTPVNIPGGYTAIGDLRVGDQILVKEDAGATATALITKIRSAMREDLRTVKTTAGLIFRCSPDHPFKTERGFVEAAQLQRGDALVTLEGSDAVESVTEYPGQFEVFDVSVDHPEHTFLVSGVVVHNKEAEGAHGVSGIVPPGYLHDSWRIGASSGEKYTIETVGARPRRGKGGNTVNANFNINGSRNPAAVADQILDRLSSL